MMNDNKIVLMIFTVAASLTCSLIITPIIIHISHKKGWFDGTDERKIHKGDIPRIGGIGIFLSLLIGAVIVTIVGNFIGDQTSLFQYSNKNIIWFIGASIIFIGGLWDDIFNMRARVKLLIQIIAAFFACMGGALIQHINIPFLWITLDLGIFAWPITVIWLVAIMNAINLIDGMDGLSGTISIIAALIFGVVFLLENYVLHSILSFILAGAISGFMFFNFPPARIFMGDSGALFIGYFLGSIPLSATSGAGGSLILPLTMLVIPIGDEIAAVIRRKRDGIQFFEPDRQHMHHKLLNMGKDERWILNLVCIFSFAFGICTVAQHFLPLKQGVYLILTDWIIAGLFFTILHFLNKKHKLSNL